MNTTPNGYALPAIFGDNVKGSHLPEIARNSKKLFVRSQDGLAQYSPEATGRILTAWEAFDRFGIEKLEEVLEYSSAIIACRREEPSFSISQQMESLGIEKQELSELAGVSQEALDRMLSPYKRSSIHSIEAVARVLGLNEDTIVFKPGADRDSNLALRLKNFRTDIANLSLKTLKTFLEASWIIQKQAKLQKWLYSEEASCRFEPDSNYGGHHYPAYLHGYYLAQQTRQQLGLGNRPIPSLRHLCESTLKIPLIHGEFDSRIAGATLSINGMRGILVNTKGNNGNVWVRRFTIAHELGHLL